MGIVTTGETRDPAYGSNVTSVSGISQSSHLNVPLTPYKVYGPCRCVLLDKSYDSDIGALSSAFALKNSDGKDGQLWTVDCPAPYGMVSGRFPTFATVKSLSGGFIARLYGLACETTIMIQVTL